MYVSYASMAKNVKSLLESIGLLASEADIYLSALQLGLDTVQNIAKEAEVSRSSAYDSIQLLQKKGLITTSLVGRKRLYAAEDPERLIQIVKEKQENLERQVRDLTGSMDVFRMLSGGEKPIVRVYEGKEAIYSFFDFIERANPQEFLEISNLNDVYGGAIEEGVLISARKGYKWTPKRSRMLFTGELRNPRSGFVYKRLNKTFSDLFSGNIAIFDKFISFVSYDSGAVGVIVESSSLASSMKVLFESAWSTGEDIVIKEDARNIAAADA